MEPILSMHACVSVTFYRQTDRRVRSTAQRQVVLYCTVLYSWLVLVTCMHASCPFTDRTDRCVLVVASARRVITRLLLYMLHARARTRRSSHPTTRACTDEGFQLFGGVGFTLPFPCGVRPCSIVCLRPNF
jgi:hypothetical protein